MITNPILPAPTAGASGNAGVSFLQKAIPAFITLGLIVGAVVFFFTLIVGAIQWISSGGDKQAIEGARGKVTNAIIGLVILLSVFAIIQFIQKFFGITILTIDISKLVIQ